MKCLAILDDVAKTGEPIPILKRGRPFIGGFGLMACVLEGGVATTTVRGGET